jgi:hypothetical protein
VNRVVFLFVSVLVFFGVLSLLSALCPRRAQCSCGDGGECVWLCCFAGRRGTGLRYFGSVIFLLVC